VADWNRGDVTAFMRGYWKSPQTEFVGIGGIMRGWETVLDRYRKNYPDRASMGHLDFTGLEVTVLGPEAALAVGYWQLKRQNDTPSGVFTLVFRKLPEGWRIINDHTSQSPAQSSSASLGASCYASHQRHRHSGLSLGGPSVWTRKP